MPKLLTTAQAAAELGLNPETIRRAIRTKRLACYRLQGCIRIAPEHLTAYLETHLCPARDPLAPDLSSSEGVGPSNGGMEASADAFRQARRIRKALHG